MTWHHHPLEFLLDFAAEGSVEVDIERLVCDLVIVMRQAWKAHDLDVVVAVELDLVQGRHIVVHHIKPAREHFQSERSTATEELA